jgi:hypothetical protein
MWRDTQGIGDGVEAYDISLRGLLRWRLAAAVLAVAVSVFFVDRACGLFISPDYMFRSLVLPPAETIRYEFRDFQFTLSTNRLGFRGPEFAVRRTPSVKRIIPSPTGGASSLRTHGPIYSRTSSMLRA